MKFSGHGHGHDSPYENCECEIIFDYDYGIDEKDVAPYYAFQFSCSFSRFVEYLIDNHTCFVMSDGLCKFEA